MDAQQNAEMIDDEGKDNDIDGNNEKDANSIYFIDGYLREIFKDLNNRKIIPDQIKYVILNFSANTFVIGYGYSRYFEVGSIKIDNIVKCAFFDDHSLFVDVEGSVYGIGFNGSYQLGLGHNKKNVNMPQLISIDANIIEVAVGAAHSILLCVQGCIYTMGKNKYNRCAQGDEEYVKSPTKCEYFISMNVVKISAAGMHSGVITSDDSVYLFGANHCGQCGVGKETDASLPQKMNLCAKNVSCGSAHTLIISANNTLYACGWNAFGQIGNNTKKDQFGLIQINLPHNVIDADGGGFHGLCILENGASYSWGKGYCGQLGHGDNNNKLVPTQIMIKNVKFKKCMAGRANSCLIDEDDNFYCFGDNGHGQLCVGDEETYKNIPTKIEKKNVMDISMGYNYSFVMFEAEQMKKN